MRWFSVIGVGLTLEMDWVASIFIFVSCKIKSRLWVGVCIWEEKGMFLKLTQRMEIEMMIFIFSLSRWFLALTWISSYFVFPFSFSSPCFLHLEESEGDESDEMNGEWSDAGALKSPPRADRWVQEVGREDNLARLTLLHKCSGEKSIRTLDSPVGHEFWEFWNLR